MGATTLKKPKNAKGTGKSQTQSKPASKRAAAKKTVSRADTLSRSKTVQMNVRIDEKTKEAGDVAFARVGLTPSQAVRLLWDYAAQHVNDPEACKQLIAMIGEGSPAEEIPDPLASMAEARSAIDSFLETWGLDGGMPKGHTNLAEYLAMLREEEALTSLRERGYAL